MTVLETQIVSNWLPIIFILVLIITIFGLSCWYFAHRRRRNIQNSNKKKPEKRISNTKPMQRILLPKTEYLSSPNPTLPTKSLSQLTNTDIAYLDKLVRTASDRSMWKRDYSKKDQHNKLRKVPSGQI